ncbi:MAG: ferrous iron transport protein B [Sarcina sp.]
MVNIALVGNPNSGKSTLFNTLTKTRQHTGNWPGVTVERKEGILNYKKTSFGIVDLPGIYSLSAASEDEVVSRDYIIKEKPDLILNIIDATNIERNLYLTTQLLEIEQNVVIALNMIDEARLQGIEIDVNSLEKKLGVKIICISALKEENIEILKQELEIALNNKKVSKLRLLEYGDDIENEINFIENQINAKTIDYPKKWIALKLLENDIYIKNLVQQNSKVDIEEVLQISNKNIEENLDFDAEIIIADKRYCKISEITKDCIVKKDTKKKTFSDKLDKIVTNKYLGIPIFAGIMLILYQLTFIIGAGLQDYTDGLIASIGEYVVGILESLGTSDIIVRFIDGGVFAGVGAVVSFLPLVMVMYFLIGILEDSGYMARAAYVMDKFMRSLGLHGKTFVSMLIGVGCNVPGIMATRTLENKKDRMIAMLINPFISCGARLPIYLVFIDAFFVKSKGLILFSLYSLGIIIALIVGKIFSKTLFKGEQSYFVMELPKYRIPSLKNIVILMFEKAGSFFKKAGMVILPMIILLWILSNFPLGVEEYGPDSILGQIGGFMAPIFAPAGFGTWQAAVAIITGIIAKETVIATMGMLYAGTGSLTIAIQTIFTPLSAISFMVFTLLYTPCLVALAAIKKESNLKWTIFTACYTFAIAWGCSTLIYSIGKLIGFN